MKRVYKFTWPGVAHPAVAVNRDSLTLYLGPSEKVSIKKKSDVPNDLFDN